VLDPVSPMDNRGCFHAASVLTGFVIGSFWAKLQHSTLRRDFPQYLSILKGAETGPLTGFRPPCVFEKFGSANMGKFEVSIYTANEMPLTSPYAVRQMRLSSF
jgi:hypothetical protein